jgi:selenocysteine lyase/cysteine desulfurase
LVEAKCVGDRVRNYDSSTSPQVEHPLIERIREAMIGADRAIEGPFGSRRLTCADFTASGRALSFIEDFIVDEVLPLYANTHTESSATGLQTSQFREDAREIIRRSVGADERDVVIFCGSGTTGAIQKLIGVLGLQLPRGLDERYGLSSSIPPEQRPVVFVGPYEHHSNDLPWRESICDVVVIEEDDNGQPDLEHLRRELVLYAQRPLRIGSFSAASNVTGIRSQTRSIASLLHQHGALSFWDYAAAGPHDSIEMNGSDELTDGDLIYKDAVFISPHKFVGGPGTPGVLVAKRKLFTNSVPVVPAGGTVCYVSPRKHHYIDDPEAREEGGTPAIVEAIRAGMVFQLKDAVGAELIRQREHSFITRAIQRLSKHENIVILGNPDTERLSILSFLIRRGHRHLHQNYVAILLNDLFGIQARAGCSCAGPYGHRLLGIDLNTSEQFEREITRGGVGIKPGWVRVNFNYFISEQTFEFLLEAIELVAHEGWKLLPHYSFEPKTGRWQHRTRPFRPALRLSDLNYDSGKLSYDSPEPHPTQGEEALPFYLYAARATMTAAASITQEVNDEPLSESFETLRWFPLPSEVAAELEGGGA